MENGIVLFRFQKDLRSHISFPYRFRPSTLERVSVLKTLKNFVLIIFSYILPPFFTKYFPRGKLMLSHDVEVCPGLVQNHQGFGGLLPSRFYYPRSARRWQTKKPYNILFSSWK